jgi:ribonuclease BN (tRNA processing enzyme)
MLRLTVVGSGDAFNSAGRGNACYLVDDGTGLFCVDFGPTALMGLKRLKVEPNEVDAVLLTHLHGDHFGGLHLLIVDAQYRGRRGKPLVIAGPAGTERRVRDWCQLAYAGLLEKLRFPLEFREWAPGATHQVGSWTVHTFPARHMAPPEAPLHLRVEADGGTVAFSGDTAWSDALVRAADGADVMVCECTEWTTESDQHVSWDVLRDRLHELRARQVVLSHLGEVVRRRAPRATRGMRKVCFADDGKVFTVRARAARRARPSGG